MTPRPPAIFAAFVLAVSLAALAPSRAALATSIPPNCTLDPFTGKQTCHILPSCTLDPFTGKMKCRTPPARIRAA